MRPEKEIVKPLLAWYDGNKRILPWREQSTPYRVWVSEIMLQQTRVEAVKPYFERFMNALPDVGKLAAVGEDILLKLWEGLGYYNRARNLQKAAKIIVEEYNGKIPDSYEELLKLPGIGSYTAGAISSIAYQKKVPAVDGNVLRIIARVTADNSDILSAKVKKELEDNMGQIMPEDRAGDFNQALMELGATVCIPNGEPKCEICPWEHLCKAKAEGKIAELPYKASKKARTIEEKTILVIQDEDKVIIRKRPAKGLLAGLYEFPMLEGYQKQEQVLDYMKKLGYQSIRIKPLEKSKHIFSHKEWHMMGYAIRVDELQLREETEEGKNLILVETKETEERYPIPTAFLAYTKYLNIRLGNKKYEIEE